MLSLVQFDVAAYRNRAEDERHPALHLALFPLAITTAHRYRNTRKGCDRVDVLESHLTPLSLDTHPTFRDGDTYKCMRVIAA